MSTKKSIPIIIMILSLFLFLVDTTPVTNMSWGTSIIYHNNVPTITITSTVGFLKTKEETNDQLDDNHFPSTSRRHLLVYQLQDYDEDSLTILNNSVLSTSDIRRDSRSNGFGSDNNRSNNKKVGNFAGQPSSNRLIHSSFRIEQDVIKLLEKVATGRDISLSALVNKILKNYTTSEMYFEELGFLLVSKNFLRKTFERLDQQHIEELGKEYGVTIAKEYVSYFYPQVNIDTLIQFLEIWFKRFQSFQHRIEESNPNLHYITVNHDINMNFSLALQSILAGLIEPIIKRNVEFTNVTARSIIFSFKV